MFLAQEANPILETFASSSKGSLQKIEADTSLSLIRWNNKQSDNVREVRKEVLDLKKTCREQKSELDEIKKSLEAYQNAINADKRTTGKVVSQQDKRKEPED